MYEIKFAYLIGCIGLFLVWTVFFLARKDTRKEMLVMSFIVGVVSVLTMYFWWNVDWWQPVRLTNTQIGPEDFLIGFASGGVMAVAYEVFFRKHLHRARKLPKNLPSAAVIPFLLTVLTFLLMYGMKMTSFWASTITLIAVAALLFRWRPDLLWNGIWSGVLMVLLSATFYAPIIFIYPEWVAQTYLFDTLSGNLVAGVPVEEFVFWFLTGVIFGPFYEYWKRERSFSV